MDQTVNKSSLLNNKFLDKSNIALFCILAMMVGFLVSPAIMSVAMMVYGVNGLWGVHPKRWLRDKWWLLGVGWIGTYAVSYFWSSNIEYWSVGLQVKLPFLLLPLAFAYTPRFSARQMRILTLWMGIILLAGVEYSLSFLITDRETYLHGYKFSHILPTPARGDHISFSLGLVMYIIWAIYSWKYLETRIFKGFITAIILIMVLFLHVLAAKSGIVALYLFLLAWSIYLAFGRKKILGIGIIVAIPLFMVFAVNYIPTFIERKGYITYTYYMLIQGDRSGNYGDIGRLMSYKLAVEILKDHPMTGAGAGDILDDMKKGYDTYYPQVEEEDRLVPHNQFLIVGVAAGIPAIILFSLWVFAPLTWLRRNRESFFFFGIWLTFMVHLLIDTALEVQMGVFINVVFLLLMRKELPQQVAKEA